MTREFLGVRGERRGGADRLDMTVTPRRAGVDDAELVVSELVANAAQHGSSACRLRLRAGVGRLVVEVHDDNSTMPVRRNVGEAAERGRGLLLVRALADRVRVSPGRDGGKTVMAVLPVGA
ncbi:ATP-binding protein [Streptomyces tsukubensis]|uniref:Histidine kinase/HSP90-like ATPase domain-containing protein n=2 Tax=Streptomyces tsukubensis TaxID=83656 RepID=A0A1V3ZZK2_9ACTN|nr:hypothetical protein B1H18_34180 [Streptomyces tsukubensis]QFR97503.1 ATP-binding protein [Streptomyces tsukubensis]